MAVDNTLRYRGFNSYELAPDETLYSSLSDCEYLGFVTTQWVALKAGGTIAGGEVRIVWIDDTGGQLGATERHTFTPTRLWERHTWTVAVPPEAVKLRIQFEGGTQGYHFACPMTEPGEIASSFDPNIASTVAYMTSEGAYVGFLNAEQITAGLLRAVNGGAWFDLDKPEIVMEGKQADLSITPENPLKLTDKSGKFVGGLGQVEGLLGLIAGMITNDLESGARATVGTWSNPDGDEVVGLFVYTEQSKNVPAFRVCAHLEPLSNGQMPHLELYANERLVLSSRDSFDSSGSGSNWLLLNHEAQNSSGRVVGNAKVQLYTSQLELDSTHASVTVEHDGADPVDFTLSAASGYVSEGTITVGSHAIGVDNTGPYFVKNGAKSYF